MKISTQPRSRHSLAGLLFACGVIWAIPAALIIADAAVGKMRKIEPILLWGFGAVVWIGWGLIWRHRLKKKSELGTWFFSILYHVTVLGLCFFKIQPPFGLDAFVIIPLWWAGALAASIHGLVLYFRDEGKEPDQSLEPMPLTRDGPS